MKRSSIVTTHFIEMLTTFYNCLVLREELISQTMKMIRQQEFTMHYAGI